MKEEGWWRGTGGGRELVGNGRLAMAIADGRWHPGSRKGLNNKLNLASKARRTERKGEKATGEKLWLTPRKLAKNT